MKADHQVGGALQRQASEALGVSTVWPLERESSGRPLKPLAIQRPACPLPILRSWRKANFCISPRNPVTHLLTDSWNHLSIYHRFVQLTHLPVENILCVKCRIGHPNTVALLRLKGELHACGIYHYKRNISTKHESK